MIHYWVELALWLSGVFLAGCALGAGARAVLSPRRPPRGDASAPPDAGR